jgi:hypothetical protein
MAIIKVKTGGITADAITSTEIADNAVVTAAINADAVTDAKIADDVVGTEHLTANEVDTAALKGDAVTGAELADNAVNSEHYTDGSIDTAHIADNQVTLAKMASGTDGNIISYDASGNPVAIATGSDGQVLTSTGAGSPPAFEAAAAGGKILQVIYASTTTEKVVSSATFVDTGLSATITPSATSSKILVICEISSIGKANNNTYVRLKLLKGSSVLITFLEEGGADGGSGTNKVGNSGCTYLDASNSTDALTFKVQMNSGGGSNYGQTGGSGGSSTMTLMEVAG